MTTSICLHHTLDGKYKAEVRAVKSDTFEKGFFYSLDIKADNTEVTLFFNDERSVSTFIDEIKNSNIKAIETSKEIIKDI